MFWAEIKKISDFLLQNHCRNYLFTISFILYSNLKKNSIFPVVLNAAKYTQIYCAFNNVQNVVFIYLLS